MFLHVMSVYRAVVMIREVLGLDSTVRSGEGDATEQTRAKRAMGRNAGNGSRPFSTALASVLLAHAYRSHIKFPDTRAQTSQPFP